ncbi:coagulase domain-containing protein [Staphylococcus aureus]|uniref:coagulase domain-containing protein n=1 Tax=Staphylococcus aureus TaxID=1280 RepID=UPI0039BEAC2A
MKKKIVGLSIATVCFAQILTHKETNAIVNGEQNPYQSESLKIGGDIVDKNSSEMYKDNLNDLLVSLQAKKNLGYDEPEYKDVYKKYQNKVLAEIEALNKFDLEQQKINRNNKKKPLNENILGLTYKRYIAVYNSLSNNKKEFEKQVQMIGNTNPDLREFNYNEQREADLVINELENKVLLIAKAFPKKRQDLYNKLDIIVGDKDIDRKSKKPNNKRMFKNMVDDLEYIIDEFFKETNQKRPKNIESLTENDQLNNRNIYKLKQDIKKAESDPNERHHQSKTEKNNNVQSENSNKKIYDDEYKEIRKKAIERINSNDKELVVNIDDDDDESNQQFKIKQEVQKEAKQEVQKEAKHINDVRDIERNNHLFKYGPRPQFNSNPISSKNNITEYSNGSVKYGPRPQFNSQC